MTPQKRNSILRTGNRTPQLKGAGSCTAIAIWTRYPCSWFPQPSSTESLSVNVQGLLGSRQLRPHNSDVRIRLWLSWARPKSKVTMMSCQVGLAPIATSEANCHE